MAKMNGSGKYASFYIIVLTFNEKHSRQQHGSLCIAILTS